MRSIAKIVFVFGAPRRNRILPWLRSSWFPKYSSLERRRQPMPINDFTRPDPIGTLMKKQVEPPKPLPEKSRFRA
jgi:hypothetical protein